MKKIYWVVVLALFLAQALFTFNAKDVMRSEDFDVSIMEPYLWQSREIFAPQNSNVGWYTTMAVWYQVFGFDLNGGRFFRLGLALVSLICLGLLLKKYLGEKIALIPLLIVGLSPTLLYFNTLNIPYGLDLQYLPIILWLILSNRILVKMLGVFLTMFAWLSYPTIMFYLPALAWLYIRHPRAGGDPKSKMTKWIPAFAGMTVFSLPVIITILWAKKHLGMIYDPEIDRGLFTSGGGFLFEADNFIRTISGSFENLFLRATSYYLEIPNVEFSHLLPLVSFILVMWMGIKIATVRQDVGSRNDVRWIVALALLTMVFNLIFVAFTIDGGMPGGRRNTPFLAGFYTLFTVVWFYICKGSLRGPEGRGNLTSEGRSLLIKMGILLVILAHHLIVYPFNFLNLKTPTLYPEVSWFYPDPQENLNTMLETLQREDLTLDCGRFLSSGVPCRYSNVYGTLKGVCLWENLSCHDIYGNLPGVGVVKLEDDTWEKYNLERD